LKGLTPHYVESEMFLTPNNFAINNNTFTQAALMHVISNKSKDKKVVFNVNTDLATGEEDTLNINLGDFKLSKALLGQLYDADWIKKSQTISNSVTDSDSTMQSFNSNSNEKIDNVASKTIYSLHFEQTPNNHGKMIEGINFIKI
jgi:hypothetical protein